MRLLVVVVSRVANGQINLEPRNSDTFHRPPVEISRSQLLISRSRSLYLSFP